MKLWSAEVAPNPRRTVIFLMEKGIEIETININLGAKENYDTKFLAKNSLARVPVLEFDDGSYLAESKAICRYFEEIQPEPVLMGIGTTNCAFVEMWDRRMESELMGNISGAFRHLHPYWKGRIEQVPDYGNLCKRNAEERMVWLDSELVGREFIAGDTFTIADITAICAFEIGRVAKIRVPDKLENLMAWYKRISLRPSVVATGPKPN